MTLQQSPASHVPTPGRADASLSPGASAHSKRKPGRPKGIPMPPEWCAVLGERSRRNWADPSWRAFMLGRMKGAKKSARPLKVISPEVLEARRVRKNLYQKMRVSGLSREQILKELGE